MFLKMSNDLIKRFKKYRNYCLNKDKDNDNIDKDNIDFFYNKYPKNKNDSCNKIREQIIVEIVNKNIPSLWYNHLLWNNLKNNLFKLIDISNIQSWKLTAGRKNNYDFEIIYNDNSKDRLEFKYGAYELSDCPQFLSLYINDTHFNISYIDFFYNNYFSEIINIFKCDNISIEEYRKNVYQNNFLEGVQDEFYKGAKQSSRFTNNEEDINRYQQISTI